MPNDKLKAIEKALASGDMAKADELYKELRKENKQAAIDKTKAEADAKAKETEEARLDIAKQAHILVKDAFSGVTDQLVALDAVLRIEITPDRNVNVACQPKSRVKAVSTGVANTGTRGDFQGTGLTEQEFAQANNGYKSDDNTKNAAWGCSNIAPSASARWTKNRQLCKTLKLGVFAQAV